MIPESPDPWVLVAVGLRPHGIRGAMILKPMTRTAGEFCEAPLERVVPRRRGKFLPPLRILHRQVHKDSVMVQFEGVETRGQAEELRGIEFLIPEEERWDLPPGVYYHDQLTGLLLLDDRTGEQLGTVTRVAEGVACDYLAFANPADPRKEVLLPAREPFLVEVDLEAGRARVALPEGLLDL